MQINLINKSENILDTMYVAARTCYSAESPIEIWQNISNIDTDRKLKLVKQVLNSGHQSIAEFINFTFAIEGVSRVLLAQITRHRIGIVFCVQSQRYVEIKESYNTLLELFENPKTDKDEDYLISIANKYFVGITKDNYRDYIRVLLLYLQSIKQGIKSEDARMILPNATKTNIVMSVNLRELIHIANLRLCTRAQNEIRQLVKKMCELVVDKEPWLSDYLVSKCISLGYCNEHNSCGKVKTK